MLVFATWLVAHVALLAACVRAPSVSRRDRWLALFPLATPWVAWRAGLRVPVIGWACLIVLYVVLRAILASR